MYELPEEFRLLIKAKDYLCDVIQDKSTYSRSQLVLDLELQQSAKNGVTSKTLAWLAPSLPLDDFIPESFLFALYEEKLQPRSVVKKIRKKVKKLTPAFQEFLLRDASMEAERRFFIDYSKENVNVISLVVQISEWNNNGANGKARTWFQSLYGITVDFEGQQLGQLYSNCIENFYLDVLCAILLAHSSELEGEEVLKEYIEKYCLAALRVCHHMDELAKKRSQP